MDRSSARKALSSVSDDQFVAVMIQVLKSHRHQGDWLTIRQMAQLADISVRSLQRRLADDGLAFSELAQTARQEIATELVAQDSLPLKEIAERLGYSKISNFSRAFHRWTGESPTEFRNVKGKRHG